MALVEETLFGTRDKVADAIQLLQDFEPEDGYYLAYSGGKDSTVLLDLAKKSGVQFDAHYNHTTVDPPELVRFIRQQPEVVSDYPDENMWDLIVKKRMPPTQFVRYCCLILKERGGEGRRVLTGVRRAESTKRAKRRQVESCWRGGQKTYVHPIFYWSHNDVWEYIHRYKLPYCSLYDEGFKRLGCICCPMGGPKGMLRDAERWPKYKDNYIRAFQRMVDKKIVDGFDVGEWKTGEDVWDWWVSHNKSKKDAPPMLFG